MGSLLRKLRAKAGVTGLDHQKRQREAYRRRERARRAERAKLEFQDGNVIVAMNSPGGHVEPESLRSMLGTSLTAEVVQRRIEADEHRVRVRQILGGEEQAITALCDVIDQYGRYLGHRSTRPNYELLDESWEQALPELRTGAAPAELTASRWKAAQATEGSLPPAPERQSLSADDAAREPGMRPKVRRSWALLATVAALAMVGGLSVPPPKGER